jgi:xylan 1,4-beta-xylosidase
MKVKRHFFRITFLCIILALSIGTALGLYAKRYEVKKFVKEHDFLYGPAKKVSSIKNSIMSFASPRSGKSNSPNPISDSRTEWRIVFDAAKSKGKFDRFWGNISYESFKSGMLNSKSLRFFKLIKESNKRNKDTFRYVRALHIFSQGRPPWGEGLEIYKEDSSGDPSYDWTLTNQVFDMILDHGLKPIVGLSFMPDDLASIPKRRQPWSKANISPPKDYQKWEELIYRTILHLRKRYGDTEVSSWYFEVWNEPDLGYLFWIEDPDPNKKPFGDMQEYFKLYDHTVRGAKRAFPNIKIGGPVSAGGKIEELLEHVLLERDYTNGDKVENPINFVSTHVYGKVGKPGDRNRDKTIIGKLMWKVGNPINHAHPEVKQAMRKMPYLLSETGPSTKARPYYNTRYLAAWLAKLVDASFYLADEFGQAYQPEEFVFWSSIQISKQFDKDKGLVTFFNVDGSPLIVKRALYNGFEALGYLSNERIEQQGGLSFGGPVHAIATRNGRKSVEVLVYHIDEEDKQNVAADSMKVQLEVNSLPFKDFKVEWLLIDETHSNAYTYWKKMGEPKKLTPLQYKKLAQNDDLELVRPVWQEKNDNSSFAMSFALQNNSVTLFRLTFTN